MVRALLSFRLVPHRSVLSGKAGEDRQGDYPIAHENPIVLLLRLLTKEVLYKAQGLKSGHMAVSPEACSFCWL